ncbi:MAG: hypothetical protein ACR2FY_12070 [Pirellulaceae bacterium]
MSTFRVHFDGTVFVPDEPVPLPPNTPLRITVVADTSAETPLARLAAIMEKLPQPASWPEDGAKEGDHFLYGTPKHGSP